MTLSVKDANQTTVDLATKADAAGNTVPVHVAGSVQNDIAVPASTAAPLPVMSTAAVAASGGNATIAAGNAAQTLFGGVPPVNGFAIQNTSSADLWANDLGAAAVDGGFKIAAGTTYTTPPGYKPAGPVSLFGGTTGLAFASRRW